MMPIRGIFPGCCALATSGQAAAPPPSSVMNWRRLGSNMGSSPEPVVPAYRRLRMHRKLPQVLGADLKSRAACFWAHIETAHENAGLSDLVNLARAKDAAISNC